MSGSRNETLYGDNVDFSGSAIPSPTVTADGQLLIGSTATPNIRVGNLTSTGSTLTITPGAGTINLEVNGSSVGSTITGDTGGALSPTLGNWNIVGGVSAAGTTPVATSGAVSTLTLNIQKSQAIAAPDATKIGLCNFDSSSFTVDANGFVALAGGVGSVTITGDTGSISGSSLTIFANQATQNCGSSVGFSNSVTTSTLNVTDVNNNTIIGASAGNGTITATECVALGKQALVSLTNGNANTSIGTSTLLQCTTGSGNVCVGQGSGLGIVGGSNNCAIGTASLTSVVNSDANIAIGPVAMSSLVGGTLNIALGVSSASAFTTTESNNIIIGNAGVIGDANTLRLGTQGAGSGQQNLCFIAGITGATPNSGNTPQVVLCDNAGNLAPISSSTSGFVLTSNGSATPSFQAIPATSFPWTDEATSFSPAAKNGYFVTGTATATLPASPSQGDTISFVVDTTNVLTIGANTGQFLRLGTAISASAGTAASNARGDATTWVYRSSDSTWICTSSIGTWTIT